MPGKPDSPFHRLYDFYRTVYRRALIRLKFGESDRKIHDDAVRRIEYFAGRPLDVMEVTAELLDQFADSLRTKGVADVRVTALVNALQRIRRSFNPPYFRVPQLTLMEADAGEGTIRHYFETVYAPQRLIGCSAGSMQNYHSTFRHLRSHYGYHPLLTELTDAFAADHFNWLLLQQGLSPKRINSGHRSSLFAVWRMAYDDRLIERLPRVKKLKEVVRVPDAWSIEEMNHLLKFCHAASSKPIAGIPVDLYWQSLFRVAWWTGLRRGTLFKLRRYDVNLQTGWLTVPPEVMKNKRGGKFRLGDDAIAAVQATQMFAKREKLLFPWHMGARVIAQQFRRILDASGLPQSELRMGQFHKIRRSTATKVAELAGVGAASSLLGHSSSVITQRYIDPSKLPGNDLTALLPGLEIRRPDSPDREAG